MKQKKKDDWKFLIFVLAALAAGVLYFLWGQRNSAGTLYDMGFLRYRAVEQLSQVGSWAIPAAEQENYEGAIAEAEAWAEGQERVSGSYVTESAAEIFGGQAKLTLDYTLYGAETGKTAILLHGFCDANADSLLWASFWQEQGYRVLIPVQRGYADPGELNYTPTTYGVYEQFDLYDLISALGLTDETVVIHGKGSGAAGAILLAANENLQSAGVDGIVAESVYDDLGETERSLVKRLFGVGDYFVGRFLRDNVRRRLGFEADSVDLCAAAKQLTIPALFLCPMEDAFLGAERTEAVSAACASPKTLRHLQGAYRTLWLTDGERYRAAMREYLR